MDARDMVWIYEGLSGRVVTQGGRQISADDAADCELRMMAVAPDAIRILLKWKTDLESINPDFNDPAANDLLRRIGALE